MNEKLYVRKRRKNVFRAIQKGEVIRNFYVVGHEIHNTESAYCFPFLDMFKINVSLLW